MTVDTSVTTAKSRSSVSLKAKLTIAMVAITLVALLVSMVFSATGSVGRFQTRMIKEIEGFADVMAHNLGPIVAFGNSRESELMLETLAKQPDVVSAVLYQLLEDGDVEQLAAFNVEHALADTLPLVNGWVEEDDFLVITRQVTHGGEQFGWLQMVCTTQPLREEIRQQIMNTALLILIGSLGAYFLARRLVRVVSEPLDHLVDVSRSVTIERNYSHRAELCGQEEIDELSTAFNRMLDQIDQRDQELKRAQAELLTQVEELDTQNRSLTEARRRESRLKNQLERAQRMESLGVLAGGVAHDLNNILGPLVGYPDLLLDQVEPGDPMHEDLVEIRDAANKATTVVQDLLALGRRGNYQFIPINLNDVVNSYLNSSGGRQIVEGHDGLQVKLNLAVDLGSIKGSSGHLNQVVMNLVINAIEAMGNENPDSTLSIETWNEVYSTRRTGFEPIEPGDFVALKISDTGKGIPPEHLEHIFEPFFSSKKLGASGSGLGLAVVYGVAKDHCAFVDVDTRLGEGTSFLFLFPRLHKPSRSIAEVQQPVGGTERVLVVDDEEAQRKLSARLLIELGYDVSCVDNGHEAISYLKDHPADILLLDMIMEEGFDGLDTWRAVREIDPEQRCVIVSGYSENKRIQEALSLGAGGFVSKPYSRAELAIAVRACLDGAPPDVPDDSPGASQESEVSSTL